MMGFGRYSFQKMINKTHSSTVAFDAFTKQKKQIYAVYFHISPYRLWPAFHSIGQQYVCASGLPLKVEATELHATSRGPMI